MEETKKRTGRGWGGKLLLTLLLLIGAAAGLIALDGRHVQFRLVDQAEITVPYGKPFQEPGRSAITVGQLFGPGRYQLTVETQGEVDTGKIGTYELTYSTEYLFETYTTRRIVHVEDITPPVITLQTQEGYEPSWFTGYEEEGFLAWDDCDGDLTDQVEREDLGDRIEYRVKDRAGNAGYAVRELSAVAPPELTLLGGEEVTVSASIDFEDPGFTARDAHGEDLSEFVQVQGEVIPYRAGSYELVYTIENPAGETVSVTRTVTVEPVEPPAAVQPDEMTIYLTFDDGPGPYTEQLLDLLAAYNVKATFFVTCLNPEYEDMVGRAFREGHRIGVHSASHNYYQIYASEQAYFEDFNKTEEMIFRQTGEYTSLFRFPGGSSNTVSSFNPGIISRLARSMNDMGYQYFDWNVTSGDAGDTTNTEVIINNIIDGCAGRRASVVLQHDIKDYSVAAVERVIIWGLRNGYTFRALDLTSPTAHHRIAN